MSYFFRNRGEQTRADKAVAEAAQYKRLAEAAQAKLAAYQQPFAPAEEDEPQPWTDADAEALGRFLRGDAGKKLVALANWQEQACNRAAVTQRGNCEYASGHARGWHQATRYFLKTLAVVQPQQDESTQEGTDADVLRERLAS